MKVKSWEHLRELKRLYVRTLRDTVEDESYISDKENASMVLNDFLDWIWAQTAESIELEKQIQAAKSALADLEAKRVKA